jgi:hypothetical protein
MGARVVWIGGGTASIVELDGDRIALDSDRPFAPGSRPEGTLETAPGEHRIWVKVHASKRRDDGTFRVNGRLMNPTRELRQILKGVVPGPIGGKSSGS